MKLLALLITLFATAAWAGGATTCTDPTSPNCYTTRFCNSKYNGRQFTCSILHQDGTTSSHVITARFTADTDFRIEEWGMDCFCDSTGKTWRQHRSAFLCSSPDGGAFKGSRISHSDFKGSGVGAPFGDGPWLATVCDDFVY